MSAPLQPSSIVEDQQISPPPSDSGKIQARLVPLSQCLLERLGTGILFLLLVFLIVIQTKAVVSHWFGEQAAVQTTQFLLFVLATGVAIGICYLAIAGMRHWQPATPPSGSGSSSNEGKDSSHRLQPATIIYASCILVFLQYETPLFATLTILATAGHVLWQRQRCHEWGTAIRKTFQILTIVFVLKQVGFPFLKKIYWPDDPTRQRPVPTVQQSEATPSDGVAISSKIHSWRNSSCLDFQKSSS